MNPNPKGIFWLFVVIVLILFSLCQYNMACFQYFFRYFFSLLQKVFFGGRLEFWVVFGFLFENIISLDLSN